MQVLMMPDYRADNPYQTLLTEALESEGVTIAFPQGYRRVFPFWRAIRQSSPPFDVLHLHWTTPYLKGETYWVRLIYTAKLLIDLWLVKRSGVSLVWTVHNLCSHEAHFPRLEQWLCRRLAQLCDRIIAHHQDAQRNITQLYHVPLEKVDIIPHGHYRTVYGSAIERTTAREQLGLPLDAKVYLNFGMLRPYKGLEALIDTWQHGQFAFKGAKLVIAGMPRDDEYGQTLSMAAQAADQVMLKASFIPDADVAVYFSAADLVVLPFRSVSTSGSLLLAMSYGKPVIAPKIGGIASTLAEADDLLYDPEDDLGLLHALNAGMEINDVEMGKRVNQVCDRLSWSSIAQRTSQLYIKALDSGKNAPQG